MTPERPPSEPRLPHPLLRPAGDMLRRGRADDRAGRLDDAIASYEHAVRLGVASGERAAVVEALRRLGVVHHRRNEPELAEELCRRSHREAVDLGDLVLAGEALNALAGFEFEGGEIAGARVMYQKALALAGSSDALRGRIEQNLGILASIQGDYAGASGHYARSLEAFEQAGDERGCALAYHNLGLVASSRGELDEADQSFDRSAALAVRVGDVYLEGLCELSRAEACHARQRYGDAMERAESALDRFERLGDRRAKSGAYKVLGMVFRDTGRLVVAEERLRSAIALAVETGWILGEAEASRELARLHQIGGQNQEALALLNTAHGLFGRLNARVDLVDIARKMADLESAFFAVVREWGQSIESADRYTFGHSERVAGYAVAVARALGLTPIEETTLRLGAYLHDVGKVRVPHEILNKPGRLTEEEFEIIRLHPVYGVELLEGVEFPWDLKSIIRWHHEKLDGTGYPDRLEGVEFPWDLKSIIRWHHEKLDGTGYPDRLRGDEIPLGAQVIGIVDVFDALTTTRSYRGAMPPEEALEEMERCRHWWREDVYHAFVAAVGAARREGERSPA